MKLLQNIAVIPARKGSIGIKNKNLILIKKKPLIKYTFIESERSRLINHIFLTTDDSKIKKLLKKHPKINIINRKKKLCTHKALMNDVIIDSIIKIKRILKIENFNLVLLQPTSPLRKSFHINEAIKLYTKYKIKKTLVSVSEPINHPYESIYKNKKKQNVFIKKKNTNRQNLEKLFFVNGNIFISDANYFLKNKSFINKNTLLYQMSKIYSIELDDLVDLKILNGLLNDF